AFSPWVWSIANQVSGAYPGAGCAAQPPFRLPSARSPSTCGCITSLPSAGSLEPTRRSTQVPAAGLSPGDSPPSIEKGLHHCNPLILLVPAIGIEPTTF